MLGKFEEGVAMSCSGEAAEVMVAGVQVRGDGE